MPNAVDIATWEPTRKTPAVFKPKQPYEEYFIAFDFTHGLQLGKDTVKTYTITAIDMADDSNVLSTITTTASATNDTRKVYAWVKAGTSGHEYKFGCQIVGNLGVKLELDATMKVHEI